jgi:hypothetical protein
VRIRLHGTPAECRRGAARLREAFRVVSVSDPYPDRGTSDLVRVYAEVRLEAAPAGPGSEEI